MKALFGLALVLMLSACMSEQTVSMGGGGGSSTQTYQDEWVDSDLVEDNGDVTMNPGVTVTEHPSVDPDDSGFTDEGPPSIDG